MQREIYVHGIAVDLQATFFFLMVALFSHFGSRMPRRLEKIAELK
jgi:hypothetical protein